MHAVFVHPDLLQRIIHTLTDLLAGHSQILRSKRHIVFHHIGDDLVIRILEHHPDGLPDRKELVLIGGIHTIDPHFPFRGCEDAVKMLGKGGFSRSVVPEDRHKAPLLDRKIDALQGILFLIHVSVMQIFRLYDHAHSL